MFLLVYLVYSFVMCVAVLDVSIGEETCSGIYEGESVNRSQMDIKRKKMWYSNIEKTFISRHIHEHWYTCPIALPVRRNPQRKKSFDCCLSHFRTSVSTSSSAKRLPPSCEQLYVTNTSHRKPQARLPFWLLIPASEHAHGVCYLDCHQAGLCCYLVIHIENFLRSLQLFYFHLWLVYWFYLVIEMKTCEY
jgi:hypothetical protein